VSSSEELAIEGAAIPELVKLKNERDAKLAQAELEILRSLWRDELGMSLASNIIQ